MSNRFQWIVVAAVLGALGALLVVGAVVSSGVGLVGPGEPAPGFRAVNVKTGDVAALSDYRDQVVLLNIWATWCKPCELEMPSMQRLYAQLGPEGLRVVAISIDTDPPDKVREWVEARGLSFDILQDRSGRIQGTYQTTGVPESFVIDGSGLIVKKQIGAWEWDQPAALAFFRRLLRAQADRSSTGE